MCIITCLLPLGAFLFDMITKGIADSKKSDFAKTLIPAQTSVVPINQHAGSEARRRST